jgi:hypothetical protein
MDIEQLCLKREELPILGNVHKIFFQIPIHPKLLNNSINIDMTIAQRIFPQVIKEGYKHLIKDVNFNNEEREWTSTLFLERDLIDIKRSKVFFMNNGFVNKFSIDNDKGGTLYFNNQKLNYKSYALTFIKFSEEKYKEFSIEDDVDSLFVYSHENINTYPKALFLRNWAIEYMNEVFRQVF